MLKILVCVKQVPDVDLVTMDPETGNLVREGVPTLTNPLDLNALEAAVQVKERYGGEITLITMGPPMAESTLREGLAVGGDDAILITGRPFGGADTLSTSYPILMAANMKGKFDLIFCGKESLDGATGQMASQLAERFDASQISCCYSIDIIIKRKAKFWTLAFKITSHIRIIKAFIFISHKAIMNNTWCPNTDIMNIGMF